MSRLLMNCDLTSNTTPPSPGSVDAPQQTSIAHHAIFELKMVPDPLQSWKMIAGVFHVMPGSLRAIYDLVTYLLVEIVKFLSHVSGRH